jgi:ribosomal protein S18 acetylase RimI-like enzyme
MSRPPVSLRAAAAADRDFLFRVYATTRDDLAVVPWPPDTKEAFLRQQFELRARDYATRFVDARHVIVERDGAPIGQLLVYRGRDEVRMLDVALLPEHRGAGVGTSLVKDLVAEARTQKLPLRLHVLVDSPARRLYERLGFHPVGEAGIYQQMECCA